jgi:hypothetical protein
VTATETIHYIGIEPSTYFFLKKNKAVPVTGRAGPWVVRRRGSHIFYTIGLQMAVRLSASRAGRPLPPGRFLVLISVRD